VLLYRSSGLKLTNLFEVQAHKRNKIKFGQYMIRLDEIKSGRNKI